MIVDAERDITFHKPLPVAATVSADSRWLGAWDKGDKGAILVRETEVRDAEGDPLYPLQGTTFARGDGNFGGPTTGQPETPAVPDRAPDHRAAHQTGCRWQKRQSVCQRGKCWPKMRAQRDGQQTDRRNGQGERRADPKHALLRIAVGAVPLLAVRRCLIQRPQH